MAVSSRPKSSPEPSSLARSFARSLLHCFLSIPLHFFSTANDAAVGGCEALSSPPSPSPLFLIITSSPLPPSLPPVLKVFKCKERGKRPPLIHCSGCRCRAPGRSGMMYRVTSSSRRSRRVGLQSSSRLRLASPLPIGRAAFKFKAKAPVSNFTLGARSRKEAGIGWN